MPSDQGGAIFIDVSLGQQDEPGQMQVSHQQAHHSAGNTWEKGLIYVAPTCQSTEHIVPNVRRQAHGAWTAKKKELPGRLHTVLRTCIGIWL
jgi:hypothetical protein